MDIDVYTKAELPTVFGVLRTALALGDPLGARERAFLATYARIVGYELGADAPLPMGAQSVRIDGAHQRKRLVQLAAMAVLLQRPVRADALAYLKDLARQLETHDAVIDVSDALHRGRFIAVRLRAMRRAMRVMFKEAWLAEGPRGMLRLFAAMMLKAAVNKDKVWNFKRLGLLPEGTLGREYWKHMTIERFGFPGEPAGIADSVSYHDIAHVLAGYEATPIGEIQQGSFQGGNRREDGFFFIQFVLLHFHQGAKITPGAPPAIDNFDPEKVLWAIHRGAQCNVDMTHQWNYWPLMSLPLHEARAAVALLPKLPPKAPMLRVA